METNPAGETQTRTQTRKPCAPAHIWRPAFLAALAKRGMPTLAALDAGVTPGCVFRARARDKEFAAAWDMALGTATDRLEAEAVRRAIEGVTKPIFHAGEQVGETIVYSDRLLEFLLKSRRREQSEDDAALAKAKEAEKGAALATDAAGRVILTPEVMEQLSKDVKRFLPSRS